MFDLYLSVEQDKREKQDLDAMNIEANSNTDLQVLGIRDGIVAEPAQKQYWGELAYREGYVIGIAQHYDQKYNIGLEQPF